jgi:hypothetical protein
MLRELRDALSVLPERVARAELDDYAADSRLAVETLFNRLDRAFALRVALFEGLSAPLSLPREAESQTGVLAANAFGLATAECATLFSQYREARLAYHLGRAENALASGDPETAAREVAESLNLDSGNAQAHALLDRILAVGA